MGLQIWFKLKSLFAMISVFIIYNLLLFPLYHFFPESSVYIMSASVGLMFLNIIHTSISLKLQNRNIDFIDDKEINQYLQDEVEVVANKIGVKPPKINVIPDQTMNASAMGLAETTSHIQVTSELVSNATREELRSTLAHELAHIYNRDILIMYILYSPYRIITLLDRFVIGMYNQEKADVMKILFGYLHHILYFSSLLILALIRLVSRQREYLADLKAAEITTPEIEIRKLRKIDKYNSQLESTPLNESREIIQQFSINGNKFFSTHPSTSSRVENISSTFFED